MLLLLNVLFYRFILEFVKFLFLNVNPLVPKVEKLESLYPKLILSELYSEIYMAWGGGGTEPLKFL
jgi:hypothetical protein